jgi:hypothetical protein
LTERRENVCENRISWKGVRVWRFWYLYSFWKNKVQGNL